MSTCPDQIQGRNPHYVNHEAVLSDVEREFAGTDGNLLVVLSGVPGCGKTATAWEIAFRMRDEFPDARLFARLDDTVLDGGAEEAFLRSALVDLGEDPTRLPDRRQALHARFQSRTAGRRMIVVVDGAVRAAQVRTLLPGEGRSLVVVTAGSSLADLAVDRRAMLLELSPLTDEAACELLERLLGPETVAAERAELGTLAGLCGNLPIALCVVTNLFTRRGRPGQVAGVVARLRDERRRLVALSPAADLSVGPAFTAAYDRLDERSQRVYRTLGLAPRTGRASAGALAEVLDRPYPEVAESLWALRDGHFVEVVDDGDDRFSVPDLVALHAESLDERPDEERLADSARLVRYHHQRTVDADALIAPRRPWRAQLFGRLRSRGSFATPEAAVAWLDAERGVVAALVAHAAAQGDLERVCSWCVLLWPFYEARKHVTDLLAVHELGVDAADALEKPDWASLLRTQKAFGHHWLGEHATAAALFAEATDLARRAGSVELEATAVEGQGLALLAHRTPQATADARAALRRNLDLARSTGDPRRVALARLHLAKAEDTGVALAALDEAAGHFAAAGEDVNLAKCRTWQGIHLLAAGRAAEAEPVLERALAVMADRGRVFDQAEALVALGDTQAALHRDDDARQSWSEAVTCYAVLGLDATEVEARLATRR